MADNAAPKTVTVKAKKNIPLAMIARLGGQKEALRDKKVARGGRAEAGTTITVTEPVAKELKALGYAE